MFSLNGTKKIIVTKSLFEANGRGCLWNLYWRYKHL